MKKNFDKNPKRFYTWRKVAERAKDWAALGATSEAQLKAMQEVKAIASQNLNLIIDSLANRSDSRGNAAIKTRKLLSEGRVIVYTSFDLEITDLATVGWLHSKSDKTNGIPAIVLNGLHPTNWRPVVGWSAKDIRETVTVIEELPEFYLAQLGNPERFLLTGQEFLQTNAQQPTMREGKTTVPPDATSEETQEALSFLDRVNETINMYISGEAEQGPPGVVQIAAEARRLLQSRECILATIRKDPGLGFEVAAVLFFSDAQANRAVAAIVVDESSKTLGKSPIDWGRQEARSITDQIVRAIQTLPVLHKIAKQDPNLQIITAEEFISLRQQAAGGTKLITATEYLRGR